MSDYEYKRNYLISDSDLSQQSLVKIQHLKKYSEHFTAFDPSINTVWIAKLEDFANEVRSLPNDDRIRKQQAVLKREAKIKREEAVDGFIELRYFIKQFCNKNKALLNEFGTYGFNKVRNSNNGMILFMHKLSKAVKKYEAELLSLSCKQEYIDGAAEKLNNLLDAASDYESYKSTRNLLTQERVKKHNELWKTMTRIKEAAKIIFADNFALMSLFFFKSKRKHDKSIKPEPGEILVITDENLNENTIVEIKNIGKVNLDFYVAESTDIEPEGYKTVEAGTELSIQLSEISNGSYNYFIVSNPNTEKGKFSVEFLE